MELDTRDISACGAGHISSRPPAPYFTIDIYQRMRWTRYTGSWLRREGSEVWSG